MIDVGTLLAPLRSDYRGLAESVVTRLADDTRVRAVLLTGSVASGTADTFSDLDLSVVVSDADAVDDVSCRLLPSVIPDQVYSAVLARGPVRIVTGVTSHWLRVDVLVEPVAVATRRTQPPHVVLVDRDEVTAGFATPRPVPPGADPVELVQEFLRVLGLLVVVIGREEYVVGTQGVMLLRDHLLDLFYLENGRSRRSGHKRLTPDLTPDQRSLLTAQPALVADETSVIEGHLAAARAFLPRARALLTERGLDWPERFYDATIRHLESAGLGAVDLAGVAGRRPV